MKKIIIGLAAFSAIAMGKEVVPEPEYVPEVSYYQSGESRSPFYATVRGGLDFFDSYDTATLSHSEGFLNKYRFSKQINEEDGNGIGWEIALEGMYRLPQVEGLDVGLGIAFQKHAEMKGKNNVWTRDELVNSNLKAVYDYWDQDTKTYNSIPLYVTAKYNFDNYNFIFEDWVAYVKMDLGYSFNISDGNNALDNYYNDVPNGFSKYEVSSSIKNGAYFGIGFGVQYFDWNVDLMYKVNTAKIKGEMYFNQGPSSPEPHYGYGRFNDSINYSRVTLSVGYKFEIPTEW